MAQFYTLEEAARVLGMSPEELKLQAQQRKVRAFMDSGSWRFRVADIDELARRRGMGSDPDLSLSDLDLVVPSESDSSGDLDLSEFQLGVASPNPTPPSMEIKTTDSDSEQEVLLDDQSVPPAELTGSSSTIIGMKPAGKRPSDSDVKLVPDNVKSASDSDVRLAAPPGSASDVRPAIGPSSSDVRPVMGPSKSDVRPATGLTGSSGTIKKDKKGRTPSDSDVTLIADESDSGSGEAFPSDPGATTLQPSPFSSSSDEVVASGESDSDFELTPSSVIDALEPESGSDFELTALDSSDEFEATPMRGPGDSDVTAAEPSASGINLARPSDSGINLQAVGGGLNLESADSIELAPLEEEQTPGRRGTSPAPKAPAPKKKADLAATSLPTKKEKVDLSATALPSKKNKADLSATALPSKADLSATALPLKGDKDIFEDTDFEVDALDSGEDQTVQLEAQSDFDLEDSDSASEVFAIDEEDVDQNAATAMGPSVLDEEEAMEAPAAAESPSAWDVEAEAPAAAPVGRPSPVLAPAGAGPEWGGLWVGFLGVATVFMLLLTFVSMDLVRNLYEFRGDGPASGLIKSIAGMVAGS